MTFDLATMPLGNGGGSVRTLEHVIEACKTPMTEIEVGPITMHERPGYLGQTYYFHPEEWWSLNAVGLESRGREYYKKTLPEMVRRAHDAGKKLRANIAGFSPRECGRLTDFSLVFGADAAIINGSCPHVFHDGERQSIPALTPFLAEKIFDATRDYVGHFTNVEFKVAPNDNPELVRDLVAVFRRYGIRKLVCCNTKGGQSRLNADGGQALAFRTHEGDKLRHAGGLAGSGSHEKSVSTAQAFILQMAEAEVRGLGGVFNGTHAKAFLDVGCVGVQTTTGYLQFGGRIFEKILDGIAGEIAA